MTHILQQILSPERLTAVVDIGANPIDDDPPYLPMLQGELCKVTGFEPQPEALDKLLDQAGPLETYLPWAVGDGESHPLHVCWCEGMTSLLQPDAASLSRFNSFTELGRVESVTEIATHRLDEIEEIELVDFLKIDIQGSELKVFEHGRVKLSRAVVVQTEMSFISLYKHQPEFWEVDKALRSLGFVPHAFAAIKRWPLAPFVHDGDERKPMNQLLEADLVYVRDFISDDAMDNEQLKHLAMVAHECYGSYDLVSRCLELLMARGAVSPDAMNRYYDSIHDGRPAPGDGLPAPISFSFS